MKKLIEEINEFLGEDGHIALIGKENSAYEIKIALANRTLQIGFVLPGIIGESVKGPSQQS